MKQYLLHGRVICLTLLLFLSPIRITTAGAQNGTAPEAGHRGFVSAVAFSPDGKYLTSGSWDNTIKIWNPADGALIRTLQLSGRQHPRALCFRPGTNVLAYIDGVQIKLFDVAGGKPVAEWGWDQNLKHLGGIEALQFSPDGSTLLTGYGDGGFALWQEKQIKPLLPGGAPLVDWEAVQDIAAREGSRGAACLARFSPAGNAIATAPYFKHELFLWKRGETEPAKTVQLEDPSANPATSDPLASSIILCHAIEYSPSGRSLAFVASEEVDIIDTNTGAIQRRIPLKLGNAVAFNPMTQEMAIADRAVVQIRDGQDYRMVHELAGHKDVVFAVAYSRDGRWIATGSRDYTVQIWDARTGAPLHTLGKTPTLGPDQLKAPND